ncbi:lasso peptide biosynthesis B2 protein [Niveispirillum sp. KHB5.9]|uniref:lasso peptide biosynthesis B2 protein n=1 Tax=Niveispirillum sp. KHB5.9 TaxID=3400269 RepID=UPI003A899490
MRAGWFRRGLALPAAERRLAVEAFILLAVSRVMLALLPFRVAMDWLGLRLVHGAGPGEEGNVPAPVVPLVGEAVCRAAAIAPFRAVCLQQAVTAALMLRRRGHATEVHFGVAKDGNGNMIAHAWSRCQGRLVTGGRQMPQYQPISVFVT